MMNKAIGLAALLFFSLPASAQAADCKDAGTRLNALATDDQQIRLEAEDLNRNPKATDLEKEAIQKRWREIDSGNLKQFKEIIAACGWPKTMKDSHSAWLLAQHADSDLAFQRQARDMLAPAGAPSLRTARLDRGIRWCTIQKYFPPPLVQLCRTRTPLPRTCCAAASS